MKRLFWLIPLLWCAHAWGTITFVNDGNCHNGTNDCTVTLNVSAGNQVIAVLTTNTLANTFSISDTNSNAYTTTLAAFTDSGSNVQTQVWTGQIATNNATDAIDMHVTSSVNFIAGVVVQFSGAATSSLVDQAPTPASYAATSTATSGTTGTTSQANEVLVGLFGAKYTGAATWTAGASYTIGANSTGEGNGIGAMIEYQVVSSTGTYTATATSIQTLAGGGFIVTLKQAGAAANPGTTILPKTTVLPKTTAL